MLVLGERDCSIQRRHQKVVEETPAPGLTDVTRRALHDAARATAESVGYVGAGTVEFLLDPATQQFWFLEMNTRLQVEHPVTECIYGVDLVALQISVAEGNSMVEEGGALAASGSPVRPYGHAVEVRLYAEDPAADWQPQSGQLTRFDIPGVSAEFAVPASYGVRLDSGFGAGDEVGTHYDAMLAKVIAWAPTRAGALRRLAGTLASSQIHGVRTNRDLLVNVLRHPAVIAGDVSTDFFTRFDLAELAAPAAGADAVQLSAFAATVALTERDKATRKVQPRIPAGWRNVVSQPHQTRFVSDHPAGERRKIADESGLGVVEVRWYGGRDGYTSADLDVQVLSVSTDRVVLEHDGVGRTFDVYVGADGSVDVESSLGHVALRRTPRFVDPADQVATGSLLAPMPGTVVSLAVEVGAEVAAGQPVLVLEAMKMQHTVSAPHDGVVTELAVRTGEQVAAGAVLAVVSTSSTSGETARPAETARPTDRTNQLKGKCDDRADRVHRDRGAGDAAPRGRQAGLGVRS